MTENQEETMVFPWNGRITGIPWPFTKFGRSLDDLMQKKGLPLWKKEFYPKISDYDDSNIGIQRCYGMNPQEGEGYTGDYKGIIAVDYFRGLDLPEILSMVEGECNYSYISPFKPSNVTWVGDKPLILAETLIETLKEDKRGIGILFV
ncbi:MAG: hypothetical protein NT001_00960 [Candidatus Woesearchaeota archaeon]|nr:hypothetical protein [Candidatus Woesearchaeota archaeon]